MFLSPHFLSTLNYCPVNPGKNVLAVGIYNYSVHCTLTVLAGFGRAARHLLFKLILTRQMGRERDYVAIFRTNLLFMYHYHVTKNDGIFNPSQLTSIKRKNTI
jgi:hypothetical protein